MKGGGFLRALTPLATRLLLLIEAIVAAYFVWALTSADSLHPVRMGLLAVIVGLGYVWLGMSLRVPNRRWSVFWAEIWQVAEILAGVLALTVMVGAAFHLGLSLPHVLLALGGSFLFDIVLRLDLRLILRALRRSGRNSRWVLLVAESDAAERVRTLLGRHSEMGLRLTGTVQPEDIPSLQAALRERVVDVLLVVVEPGKPMAQEALALGRLYGKDVKLLFSFGDPVAPSVRAQDFFGGSLVSLDRRGPTVLASVGKRVLDLIFAVLAIIVTSPILLVAALAIKRDDPHAPVIYRQVRIGLNGRRFSVYKLRTMVQGADQQPTVAELNLANGFKIRNDSRVTRPGRWIRKLSFDELPQFWNVLKGDMSIVGPRPVVPSEVVQYPDERYRRRFSVRPGITGLWQVSGRNDVHYDHRMELDLDYIDNWSLGRDLRIIAQTIPSVLTGRGAS